MGIKTNTKSSLPSFNVAYSAVLGMMCVQNAVNNAKLAEIKAKIGDAVWKKGFQGANSEAVKLATEAGFDQISLSGVLTSAYIKEVKSGDQTYHYLNVGMKDDDGRYYLSVDISTDVGQKLARKIANCKPEVVTDIKLFAVLGDPKEGQTVAYADHVATVKQDGQEVKGVPPSEELAPRVTAALTKLKDAGIDDKKILNGKRDAVETEFHIELIGKTAAAFKAHYDAKGAAPEAVQADAEENFTF